MYTYKSMKNHIQLISLLEMVHFVVLPLVDEFYSFIYVDYRRAIYISHWSEIEFTSTWCWLKVDETM